MEKTKAPYSTKSSGSQTVSDFESRPDAGSFFACYICDHKLVTKGGLMNHRKESHPTKIASCRYYLQGNCEFDSSICWYSHTQNEDRNTPQTLKEFKQHSFYRHIKEEHPQNISDCREKLTFKMKVKVLKIQKLLKDY